jgi:hypothetical protein
MPRPKTDYSKTIIYLIECNNLLVTDCYVGHTTNDSKQEYEQLKHLYLNPDSKSKKNNKHTRRLFNIIRQNDGWDNWSMIKCGNIPCESLENVCRIVMGCRGFYCYARQEAYQKIKENYPQASFVLSPGFFYRINNEENTDKLYEVIQEKVIRENGCWINFKFSWLEGVEIWYL